MLNKMAISEFWSGDFGEKMSVWGGLGALQFLGHLKRALELLILLNEPSRDILGPLSRYNHPWEKKQTKKQTNKHASVICLLGKKNTKFHNFIDRILELLQ